jgi:phosphoribosyl-ATP pyrophosphohydrolase
MAGFTLNDLAGLIAARAAATAGSSYTKSLLDKGPAFAARKFGEEAVEAIVAAVEGDRAGLTNEAADVLYHLLVVLQTRGVPFQQVLNELEKRTARSGLDEKAARETHE